MTSTEHQAQLEEWQRFDELRLKHKQPWRVSWWRKARINWFKAFDNRMRLNRQKPF